jgi:hypothetical protein
LDCSTNRIRLFSSNHTCPRAGSLQGLSPFHENGTKRLRIFPLFLPHLPFTRPRPKPRASLELPYDSICCCNWLCAGPPLPLRPGVDRCLCQSRPRNPLRLPWYGFPTGILPSFFHPLRDFLPCHWSSAPPNSHSFTHAFAVNCAISRIGLLLDYGLIMYHMYLRFCSMVCLGKGI